MNIVPLLANAYRRPLADCQCVCTPTACDQPHSVAAASRVTLCITLSNFVADKCVACSLLALIRSLANPLPLFDIHAAATREPGADGGHVCVGWGRGTWRRVYRDRGDGLRPWCAHQQPLGLSVRVAQRARSVHLVPDGEGAQVHSLGRGNNSFAYSSPPSTPLSLFVTFCLVSLSHKLVDVWFAAVAPTQSTPVLLHRIFLCVLHR
jgi:hypothetical protein